MTRIGKITLWRFQEHETYIWPVVCENGYLNWNACFVMVYKDESRFVYRRVG